MQNQTLMELRVTLASPVIVIPFYLSDDTKKVECWVLNLGNLYVKTGDQILDANVKLQDKIFDIYDIQLKDIKMQYFKSY